MLTMGKGFSSTAPGCRSAASATPAPMMIHSLWLRGTPLGWASVPEVQQMVTMSSAQMSAALAAARPASISASPSAAARASRSTVPAGASPPTTRTVFKLGAPAWTDSIISAWACLPMRAAVTMTLASVLATI
ncbi:hypothetical protein D3C80_626930 [compost metagenome]